jgi:hypothetical protein
LPSSFDKVVLRQAQDDKMATRPLFAMLSLSKHELCHAELVEARACRLPSSFDGVVLRQAQDDKMATRPLFVMLSLSKHELVVLRAGQLY